MRNYLAKIAVIPLLFAVFAVPKAFADTATITQGTDCFIFSSSPTLSNCGTAEAYVGRSTPTFRSFVDFDVSAIPAGSTVNSAVLRLEYMFTNGTANNRTFQVYESLRNWVSPTWNQYSSGNNWTTAGSGDAGTDYNSSIAGSYAFLASQTSFTSIDVSIDPAIIQGWVDGGQQNGFLLRVDNDGVSARYRLNNQANGVAMQLIVDYTPPPTEVGFGPTTAISSMLAMGVDFAKVLGGYAVQFFALLAGLFGLGWGIRAVYRYLGDQSFSVGGFYMRKLPWKGYKRFRSRQWNLENTA